MKKKYIFVLSTLVPRITNHRLVTKEYGINAEAGFSCTYTIVPKNDGAYSPVEIAFTELTGSVYCKITVTDKGTVTRSDDAKLLDEKIDIIATEPFMEPIPIWKSEAKDGDKII